MATIKAITIFLGTSAKFIPLSNWILELVVESLEISQTLFPSPLEIPQERLRGGERGEMKDC